MDGIAVVVIAGPTTSGKSALARALADEFDATIINADSMQVYRELPVLTAQPDATERASAPHRLYGVLPAAEQCSAMRWREMALAEIRRSDAAGRLPLVVGGSGLYLKALMDGLSDIPDIAPDIREAAKQRHARLGGPTFHAELAARDPATAVRLSPGDSQRLIRAWEVLEATGRPLADWQAGPRDSAPSDLRFLTVVLDPPRDRIYHSCDARLRDMVAGGAVAEVEMLLALGLDPDLPAMRALGVRELAGYLRGDRDLEDAIESTQIATRRYAKRQSTWFRHQITGARTLNEQYSESLNSEIFSFIRHILLTGQN